MCIAKRFDFFLQGRRQLLQGNHLFYEQQKVFGCIVNYGRLFGNLPCVAVTKQVNDEELQRCIEHRNIAVNEFEDGKNDEQWQQTEGQ